MVFRAHLREGMNFSFPIHSCCYIQHFLKLINNRRALGIVPKKRSVGAMSETDPNAYGIHDNPVSGKHSLRTITLKRQWELTQIHKREGRGGAGIKSSVRTIKRRMT